MKRYADAVDGLSVAGSMKRRKHRYKCFVAPLENLTRQRAAGEMAPSEAETPSR